MARLLCSGFWIDPTSKRQWQRLGGPERSLGISPISTSALWFQLQSFSPRLRGPSSGPVPSLWFWLLPASPNAQALVTLHFPTASLGPKDDNGVLLLLISRMPCQTLFGFSALPKTVLSIPSTKISYLKHLECFYFPNWTLTHSVPKIRTLIGDFNRRSW